MENTKMFICNISESPRIGKARSFTFYLDKIKQYGCEFEKLEAVCTDGDIHPPYPYQWRATTKLRSGEDDSWEGVAGSPLEAVRLLYLNVKEGSKYSPEDEEID